MFDTLWTKWANDSELVRWAQTCTTREIYTISKSAMGFPDPQVPTGPKQNECKS
jgi:hypothetical protein